MKSFISFLTLLLISTQLSAKTLVYCSEASPEAFNPQITLSGTSAIANSPTIYDRLIATKYGSTELEPGLAEKWTISSDKKVFTFYLRKKVKFQSTDYFKPTRDFNADDVLFSINRQWLKGHEYHKVGGGVYQYFQAMGMSELLESVKKINDYQVQITLRKPDVTFLSNLAMHFMAILSAEYGSQLSQIKQKNQIDVKPIGTGPFALKQFVRDSLIRYKAHDSYWRGRPNFDTLVFAITPDPSVRLQKLKQNECQLIIYPSPADLDVIRHNPDLVLGENNSMNVSYIAMNTEKKPFNNVVVRRAIAHALNKPAYIKAIYLDKATVAKNPFPPTMWSYNSKVEDYEYNPEKARQLLKDVGLENGFDTTLWTLSISRAFNPNGKKLGEMMKSDLQAVGIRAQLQTYDWATYLEKTRKGEQEILQLGWTGDNGDPDNFLYTLFSCDAVTRGSNNARYCGKDFDSLIRKARQEINPSVRKALYEKSQIIFKRDTPVVPITHTKVFRAYRSNLIGYQMDPFDQERFFMLDLQ